MPVILNGRSISRKALFGHFVHRFLPPRLSRLWITAAVLAALLGTASVGAIVGASSVPKLHACVQKTTNLMRYVAGTTCRTGEKLLTWNTQGITGARGPAGPAGSGGLQFYSLSGSQTETVRGRPLSPVLIHAPAGEYIVDVAGSVSLPTGVGDVVCSLFTSPSGGGPVATSRQSTIGGIAEFTAHQIVYAVRVTDRSATPSEPRRLGFTPPRP